MNHTWIWLGFAVVFGAVFGSFINVVIYRLPAGISLLNPRFSFCPKCRHTIAWWENIPVLAWFYLGGKCTSCRQSISPIYPIIEALTAALFGLVFWAFYLSPFRHADFGLAGLAATWPILLVYLALLIGMIAATVIDAKLYIIPLQIPWFVTAVAVVLLPVGFYLVPGFYPLFHHGFDRGRADFYYLMIAPQAVDIWLGAAIGGAAGWLLALVLLHTHVIPQSFSEDEAAHDAAVKHPHVPSEVAPLSDLPPLAPPEGPAAPVPPVTALDTPMVDATSAESDSPLAPPAPEDGPAQSPAAAAPSDQPLPLHQMPAPVVMASSGEAPPVPPATQAESPAPAISKPETPMSPAPAWDASAPAPGAPAPGASDQPALVTQSMATPSDFGVATATVPDPLPTEPAADHAPYVSPVPQNPDELDAWLSHPHLMREIAKECIFVAFPLIGFILGALLYHHVINPLRPPLIPGWAQILGGVVCGYLVGGGLIWIIRIIGTFAFRKEAMGLGDIHLLAAMGAVMGATDATLIFFLAPFLGLAYAACVLGLNRLLKGQIRIIPYGPFLAITAVLVMIFEKAIWMKLGR